MQPITSCLWFDDQAEAAARFYTAIFPKSKVIKVTRYGRDKPTLSGRPPGSVMAVVFEINGQEFTALNGGPHFKINEAVSFVVKCRTQAELDSYWKKLTAGGQESRCGWLKDKFGVSWQIVPAILDELMDGKNHARSDRVMDAILSMVKLDIRALKKAAADPPSRRAKSGKPLRD